MYYISYFSIYGLICLRLDSKITIVALHSTGIDYAILQTASVICISKDVYYYVTLNQLSTSSLVLDPLSALFTKRVLAADLD